MQPFRGTSSNWRNETSLIKAHAKYYTYGCILTEFCAAIYAGSWLGRMQLCRKRAGDLRVSETHSCGEEDQRHTGVALATV